MGICGDCCSLLDSSGAVAVEFGYGDLTGKAAQGVKALITTAQNMVLEVGRFYYLYGKTIQAAVNQGIKRVFIGSMVKIIGTTTGMPLVSAGVNALISIFSSWENINMGKYFVLGIFFATLLITRIFATQLQGGLRFSGSNKMMVSQTSLIRKILLGKKKKDYPLKIYKTIPFAISFVLCCIVLLLFVLYGAFYAHPFGNAIGSILESKFLLLISILWFLLSGIYIGIIQAL